MTLITTLLEPLNRLSVPAGQHEARLVLFYNVVSNASFDLTFTLELLYIPSA